MATTPLYQESIDYITDNINAPTSKIPKNLLEYWYVSEDIADYMSSLKDVSSFGVFLHAYETYTSKTLGESKSLSSLDSILMFGQFQLLIGIALEKEKDVACNSINLFDFDNYSKLNITVL